MNKNRGRVRLSAPFTKNHTKDAPFIMSCGKPPPINNFQDAFERGSAGAAFLIRGRLACFLTQEQRTREHVRCKALFECLAPAFDHEVFTVHMARLTDAGSFD